MQILPLAAYISARLNEDKIRPPVATLVRAACLGDRELADEINGSPHPPRQLAPLPPLPPGPVYLDSVATTHDANLRVSPANGLTVVAGHPGQFDPPAASYWSYLSSTNLASLGSTVDSSNMLDGILGLTELRAADHRLATAVSSAQGRILDLQVQRTQLVTRLAVTPDDRAQRLVRVLAAERPDLDAAAAILSEPQVGEGDTAAYRDLVCRQPPDAAEVAEIARVLRRAAAEQVDATGVRLDLVVGLAEMLRLALYHHEDGGGDVCPVCQLGTLDDEWCTQAETALGQLRGQALGAHRAVGRLDHTLRQAHRIVGSVTPVMAVPEVDTTRLRAAIDAWRAAPREPIALADHLDAALPELIAATHETVAAARRWLSDRDSGWRRQSAVVQGWLGAARRRIADELELARLESARTWLAQAIDRIRTSRLSRLRVAPPTIDDSSQRRAYGVAVFLALASADDGPWRFVVLDDPTDGLTAAGVRDVARQLVEVAKRRQVVVFVRDVRLRTALRRLHPEATVIDANCCVGAGTAL